MFKKILIINTHQPIHFLFHLFKELSNKKFSFLLFSTDIQMLNKFKEHKMINKKIKYIPNISKKLTACFFVILLPFLYILSFFFLFYFKFSKKIQTIICFDLPEKIVLTPIAKILKIKVIWFELPGENKNNKKIINGLFRFNSRFARIITLNSRTKDELQKLKIKLENITTITPSIDPAGYKRQENIFDNIAHKQQSSRNKKFFTIGTTANLKTEKQKIEILFQTIKKCLTVIPDLQLIIIGDGEEKKNLMWIAKKMEIDNLIWFISEQSKLKKWLESFDIFIATYNDLKISNIDIIMKAMATGLPIIGPLDTGLEDIIEHHRTGIITETNKSETLAQEIIKLQQDKDLRSQLGQNSKKAINNFFTTDKTIEQIEAIIR